MRHEQDVLKELRTIFNQVNRLPAYQVPAWNFTEAAGQREREIISMIRAVEQERRKVDNYKRKFNKYI